MFVDGTQERTLMVLGCVNGENVKDLKSLDTSKTWITEEKSYV
jgi:hypothetical protein